jgi:hypothetical protein
MIRGNLDCQMSAGGDDGEDPTVIGTPKKVVAPCGVCGTSGQIVALFDARPVHRLCVPCGGTGFVTLALEKLN